MSKQLTVIILSGGFGTRLKKTIGEIPKILAPIDQRPFIEYLLEWLKEIITLDDTRIIFSVYHKSDEIIKYIYKNHIKAAFSIDEKPLGTFGAVCNSALKYPSEHYLILNGDTIINTNLKSNYKIYLSQTNYPLLLLKESINNDRYGGYCKIKDKWFFSESSPDAISLGAYFISHKQLIKRWNKSTKINFSEFNLNNLIKRPLMNDKDCLAKGVINGLCLDSDTEFIDIGVRESFIKAQKLIPKIIENLEE